MADSTKLDVAFLYDDTLDSTDGVAQYVKTLGAWLSDNGHQVSYLVGNSKLKSWHGDPIYSLSKNLKVAWAGNRMSVSLFPKLRDIKTILDQKKFDVVHVQVPYSPFMAKIVINKLKPTTAVVGTVHIFPSNRFEALGSQSLRLVYGASLKRIDSLLSVSPAAQAYAKQNLKVESSVLPNVVNLKSFASTAKPAVKSSSKTIVFLGRLVKRKGCLELIKAFARARKNGLEAKLVVAGNGPLRPSLEKYVSRQKLSSDVKFLGFIAEADKPALLAGADLACFPSLYGESFGIVLIEAMAAGAGVVLGGDNDGYRTVLGQRAELLVNPKDQAEFAERLKLLLDDQNLRQKLHTWQINEVKKYDVAQVGPQLLKTYTKAIAMRLQRRHN